VTAGSTAISERAMSRGVTISVFKAIRYPLRLSQKNQYKTY
jgi:hypothetical protein